MSYVNLGRTSKGNFVLYSNDGMGRDEYISYNDGGFWKDYIKIIKIKPDYQKYKNTRFHSLSHRAAPFKYYSDGSGRDSYILQQTEGMTKNFVPMATQTLSKFLRTENKNYKQKIFLTKSEKNYFNKLRKIQNNVVKRLYYMGKKENKNNKKERTSNSCNNSGNKKNKIFGLESPEKDAKKISINKNIKINEYKKFINPLNNNIKDLFNRKLNKKIIHKNNSLNNIGYNNTKVKVLKDLKMNSVNYYKINNITNITNKNNINNYTQRKIRNNIFKYYKINNSNNKKIILKSESCNNLIGENDIPSIPSIQSTKNYMNKHAHQNFKYL